MTQFGPLWRVPSRITIGRKAIVVIRVVFSIRPMNVVNQVGRLVERKRPPTDAIIAAEKGTSMETLFEHGRWIALLAAGIGMMSLLQQLRGIPRAGTVAALMFLVAAVAGAADLCVETDGETASRLTVDLCRAFQRKDPMGIEYFSIDATTEREMYRTALRLVTVRDDLRLTDFHTSTVEPGRRCRVRFRANATIHVSEVNLETRQPARFELTYDREPTGWRITAIRRLNPLRDEEMGILDRRAQ